VSAAEPVLSGIDGDGAAGDSGEPSDCVGCVVLPPSVVGMPSPSVPSSASLPMSRDWSDSLEGSASVDPPIASASTSSASASASGGVGGDSAPPAFAPPIVVGSSSVGIDSVAELVDDSVGGLADDSAVSAAAPESAVPVAGDPPSPASTSRTLALFRLMRSTRSSNSSCSSWVRPS
jgi:hypothetical protein